MKEPLVSQLLKYALYAVFVVGLLGMATLPFMLERYTSFFFDAYYLQPGYRSFILTFLLSVIPLCLWIALEMIGMLRSIPKGPFVKRNVRALNRIGVIFFALTVMFFGKCVMYVTILTLLCGFLFIGGGLFALTLAALIRQAVTFREENELTI
jgi:hypothetical protein